MKNLLGSVGSGYKSAIFKKSEFRSELAPLNSSITHWVQNDEEMVTMKYKIHQPAAGKGTTPC